jgi:hypothetical protein
MNLQLIIEKLRMIPLHLLAIGLLINRLDLGDLQDLQYLLAAYLYSRYPMSSDQRWSDPSHPIRPARPRAASTSSSTVLPAMIPSA